MSERVRRDLGQHRSGVQTEEWRCLSWYMGDGWASAVCDWASARDDGEDQLRSLLAAIMLSGHDSARETALDAIWRVDPTFKADQNWSNSTSAWLER